MAIKFYDGPVNPKVLVIGDFPTHEDTKTFKVFANSAGKELRRALDHSGLMSYACGLTYAFLENPKENKFDALCTNKAEAGKDYPFKPFAMGKYIRRDLVVGAINHLQELLAVYRPEILVATGSIACWLVLESASIGSMRGSIFPTSRFGLPAIATYSFSQILKQWNFRPIALKDFGKVLRFTQRQYFPRTRKLLVEPTYNEVAWWINKFVLSGDCELLSFDIETAKKQITCIGFSPNPEEAICIPFFDPDKPGKNYWPTAEVEYKVWRMVKRVLETSIPKLAQNGLYDVQYCIRNGWLVKNFTHDTMLRHHSLYPEMEKGLGFMGTIYTDEQPWKMLRNRHRDQLKLED